MSDISAQRQAKAKAGNSLPIDSILVGSALELLSGLPESSVDCVVTSPPYFGQRDYSTEGQLGIENTPAEYVANLVSIFSQVQRILKPTGSLWLNIGDKYDGLHLLGMPWRVALALKEAGWILRSDVIWHKPNAMPSSVKNRLTTDHEYIFFFSKSDTYFYDTDAIREPHITFTPASKMRGGRGHFGKVGGTPEQGKNKGNSNLHRGRWDQAFHEKGRNKRSVWSVPLSKHRDAHFAVFPEKLIEPCVIVGCPENGIVLDPFMGSGTTAVVAIKHRRHYVGIEINQIYADMAKRRIKGATAELF